VPDIAAIIQDGAANPWLYLPLAVLLGTLHALEPGHSKTMMAGFIVAVRGTPGQATLLGVSAAIGHTIVVWGLAVLGLYLGDKLILERAEPWLIFASGILIMALAFRIFWMLRRNDDRAHDHMHDHERDSGRDHGHADHHHDHEELSGDTHSQAHAREIKRRFAGGNGVTNLDIAWFGFTGGLLPCPAAIAVLLICLQLKAFPLGIGMVAAFSIGLAITLVSVGIAAAWAQRAASARWGHKLEELGDWLPYVSASIVFAIGAFIALRGVWQLGLATTV
jgi:nickel/cobalt exporter